MAAALCVVSRMAVGPLRNRMAVALCVITSRMAVEPAAQPRNAWPMPSALSVAWLVGPLHHLLEALLSRPAASFLCDERGYRDTLIVL
jgi:hypothetical protein